jgi:hypothetical protein
LGEVALPLLSEARVVYLYNDPVIVQIGQNLFDGDEHTAYLHTDVRCAGHVLNHPRPAQADQPG